MTLNCLECKIPLINPYSSTKYCIPCKKIVTTRCKIKSLIKAGKAPKIAINQLINLLRDDFRNCLIEKKYYTSLICFEDLEYLLQNYAFIFEDYVKSKAIFSNWYKS
jgi:hypothetical protein